MTKKERWGHWSPPDDVWRALREAAGRCVVLLVALAWGMTSARAEDTRLYYKTWHYEAVVHENYSVDVTETMTVHYNESMHGIWRYIPTRFFVDQLNDNGVQKRFWYKTDLDMGYVSATCETETADDSYESVVLKIGDADRYVSGDQEYSYSYTIQFPNDRVSAYDFFYMSVLGADMENRTERFTFNIKFDKALPADADARLQCYSGDWGQGGNALGVSAEVDEYSISGEVDNIPDHNAVTLKLALPQGYFNQPSLPSSWPAYMFLGIAALLTVYVLLKELMMKSDKATSVVTFYAPEGISSAEVGTIIDDTVDMIDLTSLVPYLAGKGYLKVEEIPDSKGRVGKHADLRLHKLKDLPEEAPDYQKRFMKVFFEYGDSCLVSTLGDKHVEIDAAKNSLEREFSGEKTLTEWAGEFFTLNLAILVAVIGLTKTTLQSTFDFENLIMWGLLWGLPMMGIAYVRIDGAKYKHIAKRSKKIWSLCVSVLVSFMAFACTTLMLDEDDSVCVPEEWIAYLTLMMAVAAHFCSQFNRDTEFRKQKIGQLLGLKEFIETAEADRLKMLVDENPEYFYEILPYAMVFELSDKWASQFANLNIEKPDWYESKSGAFTGSMFASNLSASMSQSLTSVVESSSHDPSSSSSSGGGFSGGGGGGGGGGGW